MSVRVTDETTLAILTWMRRMIALSKDSTLQLVAADPDVVQEVIDALTVAELGVLRLMVNAGVEEASLFDDASSQER